MNWRRLPFLALAVPFSCVAVGCSHTPADESIRLNGLEFSYRDAALQGLGKEAGIKVRTWDDVFFCGGEEVDKAFEVIATEYQRPLPECVTQLTKPRGSRCRPVASTQRFTSDSVIVVLATNLADTQQVADYLRHYSAEELNKIDMFSGGHPHALLAPREIETRSCPTYGMVLIRQKFSDIP